MKKITILKGDISIYDDPIVLHKTIKKILKKSGNTRALVCLRNYPKAPYNFQYFGDFNGYSAEEYLKNYTTNLGNVVGLPNIDRLVSIQILSNGLSEQYLDYSKKIDFKIAY